MTSMRTLLGRLALAPVGTFALLAGISAYAPAAAQYAPTYQSPNYQSAPTYGASAGYQPGAQPQYQGGYQGGYQPAPNYQPAPSYQAPAYQPPAAQASDTYSSDEIVAAGHQFFGKISGGLATMVENVVGRYGLPNGYIIGQEASGALLGGLRYGEGTLYTKAEGQRTVFWQGPSFGWDVGGDGNRTMMLVYDLPNALAIYKRYAGVNGSAYLVGGFGMTVLSNTENPQNNIYVVPIRSGLGARLGVNVGYLKFTPQRDWNPF